MMVAWTENEKGGRLGAWEWVRGKLGLEGKGRGKVVRYFNVHKELLQEKMEVGVEQVTELKQ